MNYFQKLISNGDEASSKRFIAIFVTCFLLSGTCIAIWIKGSADDYSSLVVSLCFFIGGLVGVAAYQKVKEDGKKDKPD